MRRPHHDVDQPAGRWATNKRPTFTRKADKPLLDRPRPQPCVVALESHPTRNLEIVKSGRYGVQRHVRIDQRQANHCALG